jgi:hypothetical protein
LGIICKSFGNYMFAFSLCLFLCWTIANIVFECLSVNWLISHMLV